MYINVKMGELENSNRDPASTSTSPPPLLAHTSRLATRRLVSTFIFTAPISTDIKNISERTFVKTFKKSFFGRLLTLSLLLRNKEIYLYFYKVLYFPRK